MRPRGAPARVAAELHYPATGNALYVFALPDKKSVPASTSICAEIKSFHEVVWLRWGGGAMPVDAECFLLSDPTRDDLSWLVRLRRDHSPIRNSLAPSGPPKLPAPVESGVGLGTAGIWRMVAGWATRATPRSALRPRRLPISANTDSINCFLTRSMSESLDSAQHNRTCTASLIYFRSSSRTIVQRGGQ